MRLRNKNTGEIVESLIAHIGEGSPYDSIAALSEEWEDHAPSEPLLKDEKIRRAFKAWAETLGDSGTDSYKYDAERFSFNNHVADSTIEFPRTSAINCEDRHMYTLEELCGND